MGYNGQGLGLGQDLVFRFVGAAGQAVLAGADARGLPLSYVPGFVDVYRNGRRLTLPDDAQANDGSQILLVGYTSAAGDEWIVVARSPWSPANTYTQAQADSLFNRRRNRNYDPGMRVSQEQGNTLLTLANGVITYPCDGMACVRNGSTGGVQVQRVQSITPAGSGNRVRFTVTAANATPAASDYLIAYIPIEGQEITDLRFGSAGAKMILYRVTLRMPVACKLTFGLRNNYLSPTRSFLGTIEILPGEAGQDVMKYILVPGDTSGSWSTDNNVGAVLALGFQVGSSFQGVQGWQAGNFIGLAANSNMMATAGWSFDVMDHGTYDVSDITNPVPPRFEMKSFGEDLRDCKRYWVSMKHTVTPQSYVSQNYPVTMRTPPALNVSGPLYGATIEGISEDRWRQGVAAGNPGYGDITVFANARMI